VASAKPKKAERPSAAEKIPDALTAPEPHPYLAKIKPGIAKRFSLTRMEPMFETVDFAWYLVALGREREARGLVEGIAAGVTFSGNYNIWSPASGAITLAARLARLAGDERRRSVLVGRLIEHPALATMGRLRFDAWVAGCATKLDEARAESSQKWACHRASRCMQGAGYLRETLGAGFEYDGWTTAAALDVIIDGGIALLRERLPAEG
jgi:hypothetical protein